VSTLTLVEFRVRLPAPSHGYALVTAEWFKTWEGNPRQYRMTWRAEGLHTPKGSRYYATPDDAVAAAFRCARKLWRGK